MTEFQALFHKRYGLSFFERIQPVMEKLLFIDNASEELDCPGFQREF